MNPVNTSRFSFNKKLRITSCGGLGYASLLTDLIWQRSHRFDHRNWRADLTYKIMRL
jgi:hypothetical protein